MDIHNSVDWRLSEPRGYYLMGAHSIPIISARKTLKFAKSLYLKWLWNFQNCDGKAVKTVSGVFTLYCRNCRLLYCDLFKRFDSQIVSKFGF